MEEQKRVDFVDDPTIRDISTMIHGILLCTISDSWRITYSYEYQNCRLIIYILKHELYTSTLLSSAGATLSPEHIGDDCYVEQYWCNAVIGLFMLLNGLITHSQPLFSSSINHVNRWTMEKYYLEPTSINQAPLDYTFLI